MPKQPGFELVNDAVNATFFDGRFEALPVYLAVEDKVSDELAFRLGVSKEAVIPLIGAAIVSTLRWTNRTNIYAFHTDAVVGIDGSRFKAVNNRDRNFTQQYRGSLGFLVALRKWGRLPGTYPVMFNVVRIACN